MSTYAIGDIQGCFSPFMRLLEKIQFDPNEDVLWLTGDLVNRGTESLETLRFLMSLKNRAIAVLGNHDLTLLAVAYEATPYDPRHHTFKDILTADDKPQLITWLRHRPFLHHDPILGYTLVHAGLHPHWDLSLALSLAQEAEAILQGNAVAEFLPHLYGNEPSRWDPKLSGYDRIRFIINCFTRLRFCSPEGQLELTVKEATHLAPPGYLPWFSIPERANRHLNILFGHWASLQGKCPVQNVFALDTGCVWGNCLTAMRLEDQQRFTSPC